MAIAVNGGHVSRALDFYNTDSKYFIIGGTTPWEDDTTPLSPSVEDYKLIDVVGLKKVDNTYMVIPTDETENVISYRNQNWKRVEPQIKTTIGTTGVTAGSKVITVFSVAGLTVGAKVRVNNLYEGKITNISGLSLTLDTEAPVSIPAGSEVLGGALVEGAKYVYVDCYLEYDNFPLVTYRQIGLCTNVVPVENIDRNILRSARYNPTKNEDEYTSLGILEVLDNRVPGTRDIDQRELLSLIIEF